MPLKTTPTFIPPLPRFPVHRSSRHIHTRRLSVHHLRASAKTSSTSTSQFDWSNQWYPLSLIRNLPTTSPRRITILSTPLVVWNSNGVWTVLHDRCPHRLAALSEGRITESGTLECAYHGWQFSSQGVCLRIPQQPHTTPTTPPSKPCATKPLPTQISSSILFVWLGTKPVSEHSPSIPPILPTAPYLASAFERTLPLCFTTLLQNVLDPAHVHFAHHGTLGARPLAQPVPIRVLAPASENGFLADYYKGAVRVRFLPPCLVEIRTQTGYTFLYYAVPVRAGMVRTIALRFSPTQNTFPRIPAWMDHARRNLLLEQDLNLMRTQQHAMRAHLYATASTNYTSAWNAYHMPTSADRLIDEMRSWLRIHAPPLAEHSSWFGFSTHDEDDGLGRNSVDISRMHTHVESCADCMRALRTIQAVEKFAQAVAVISAVGSSLATEQAHRAAFLVPVLLSVLTYAAARRLTRVFH